MLMELAHPPIGGASKVLKFRSYAAQEGDEEVTLQQRTRRLEHDSERQNLVIPAIHFWTYLQSLSTTSPRSPRNLQPDWNIGLASIQVDSTRDSLHLHRNKY